MHRPRHISSTTAASSQEPKYTERHNNVVSRVHRATYPEYNLEHSKEW